MIGVDLALQVSLSPAGDVVLVPEPIPRQYDDKLCVSEDSTALDDATPSR